MSHVSRVPSLKGVKLIDALHLLREKASELLLGVGNITLVVGFDGHRRTFFIGVSLAIAGMPMALIDGEKVQKIVASERRATERARIQKWHCLR